MSAQSLENLLDFDSRPSVEEVLDFNYEPPADASLVFDYGCGLDQDLSAANPVVVLPRSDSPGPASQYPWPPKLCLDLALGFDKEDFILEKHGITPETYERIKRLPAFRRDLATALTVVREEGLTFKTKCRMIAEDFVDTIALKLDDPDVGLSARLDMFKQMVELGGLKHKEEKTAADAFAGLPRIAISINL